MKIAHVIAATLSLLSLGAWAAGDVVIVVNKNNKAQNISKKELQDFYAGELDKFKSTGVKAKLCINVPAKEQFFKKIELSENQAAANKAKLLAIGKADKIVNPKSLESSSQVVEYINRNVDGGVCFISQDDYNKLKDDEKKDIRVIGVE
jgi:hypothetical protein